MLCVSSHEAKAKLVKDLEGHTFSGTFLLGYEELRPRCSKHALVVRVQLGLLISVRVKKIIYS